MGLDVFGVGEHHRLDIPISSPAVVMAAIAAANLLAGLRGERLPNPINPEVYE